MRSEIMKADKKLTIYVDKNEHEVISQLVDILDYSSFNKNADYADVARAIAFKEINVNGNKDITIYYEF